MSRSLFDVVRLSNNRCRRHLAEVTNPVELPLASKRSVELHRVRTQLHQFRGVLRCPMETSPGGTWGIWCPPPVPPPHGNGLRMVTRSDISEVPSDCDLKRHKIQISPNLSHIQRGKAPRMCQSLLSTRTYRPTMRRGCNVSNRTDTSPSPPHNDTMAAVAQKSVLRSQVQGLSLGK